MKPGHQLKKKLHIREGRENEGGFVIIAAILMIAIFAIMGTVAVITTTTEMKISNNHKGGVQSFYVAEAGVQRAKAELKTAGFDDVLTGSYGGSPGVLSFGTDTAFADGTYSVTVQDNNDGDGDTSDDSDNIVNIIATSSSTNGSSSSVELQILKTVAIPPINGPISIVGEADTWIHSSPNVNVDGRDWRLSDTDITGPTGPEADKYAIALCNIGSGASSQTPADALADLDNDILDPQAPNFVGKPAAYIESIGLDTGMTSQELQTFVDAAKNSAHNTLMASDVPANGDIFGDTVGLDNQITIGTQTIEMGSVSNPKITYFNMKAADNGGVDRQVDFQDEIAGCGILIIEGNDLLFRDQLDWTGLVIVIGDKVGAGLMGPGVNEKQKITGAFIVDEQGTDPGGYKELVLKWDTQIRYSSEAVNLAKNLVNLNTGTAGNITVLTWRQL